VPVPPEAPTLTSLEERAGLPSTSAPRAPGSADEVDVGHETLTAVRRLGTVIVGELHRLSSKVDAQGTRMDSFSERLTRVDDDAQRALRAADEAALAHKDAVEAMQRHAEIVTSNLAQQSRAVLDSNGAQTVTLERIDKAATSIASIVVKRGPLLAAALLAIGTALGAFVHGLIAALK